MIVKKVQQDVKCIFPSALTLFFLAHEDVIIRIWIDLSCSCGHTESYRYKEHRTQTHINAYKLGAIDPRWNGSDWSKKRHNTSLPAVVRSRRTVQLNRHRVVVIGAVVGISGILPHFKIIRALHNQATKLHIHNIAQFHSLIFLSSFLPFCYFIQINLKAFTSISTFLYSSTNVDLSFSWLKNTYRLHFIYEWMKWLAIAMQLQSECSRIRLRQRQQQQRRRRQQLWL